MPNRVAGSDSLPAPEYGFLRRQSCGGHVGLRTRLPPSLSYGGQDGPTRPYRAVPI